VNTRVKKIGAILAGVDLILHGGDIYLLSVLDESQNIAPVLVALENDDTRLITYFFSVQQSENQCIGSLLTSGVRRSSP